MLEGTLKGFPSLTEEEKIEVKRFTGQLSCAECRRLKLKCDRQRPCSSCVRRGCSTICPNGTLSMGHGKRPVVSNTDQLHQKISEMSSRIQDLENALATFQSAVSPEVRRLLRDDFARIKYGLEVTTDSQYNTVHRENPMPSLENHLGALAIDSQGQSKYFGRSGGAETLFVAAAELESVQQSQQPESGSIPPEVALLPSNLPITPGGSWDIDKSLDMLCSYLPPQTRASTLFESYMEQGGWLKMIERDEFSNEIMAPLYRYSRKRSQHPDSPDVCPISPQQFAVLCLVFAIGALTDLTSPPYNAESEKYYYLGRAALCLRPILEFPQLATIEALVMMAAFHVNGGKWYAPNRVWALLTLASKLSHSMGLHRDPSRWKLDPATQQRYRRVFWETYSLDLYFSLSLGRPPSLGLSYADCEFPDQFSDDIDRIYSLYKWSFTKDILSVAVEQSLAANSPDYQTILDLDKRIREMAPPKCLDASMVIHDDQCSPATYMRTSMLSNYRVAVLIYIHRCFFAQAMLDHPTNPLLSPYAPSFLTAYRCASTTIQLDFNHFKRFPTLFVRWWIIWTNLLSAAIIVGSLVVRAPTFSVVPRAYHLFCLAVDLFEQGAQESSRARSALVILRRLRLQVERAYSQFHGAQEAPILPATMPSETPFGDDDLALFGGYTRLLFSKGLSSPNDQPKPTDAYESKPLRSVSEAHSEQDPLAITDDVRSCSTLSPPPSADLEQNNFTMEYLLDIPNPSPDLASLQPPCLLDDGVTNAGVNDSASMSKMDEQWAVFLRDTYSMQ